MTFGLRRRPAVTRPVARPRARLRLDGFEDRVVPAAPPVLGPALAAPAPAPAALIPINISSITVNPVTGALNLVGTVGNQVFTAAGQLGLTAQQTPSGVTPILNLHLNEIHLNLLGLTVDTSQICLDITAQSGPGNLLGNLLTGVANLLNGPNPPSLSVLTGVLGNFLADLTPTQLTSLGGELTTLVNDVLGLVTAPSAATSATGNILHLSLGPVNLNLLGLGVSVDNCAGGPITVDVGAQTGPGKLLGNLLNSLSHLLDGNAAAPAVTNALGRVGNEIGKLVNL